jgi:hypothetical protein
MIPSSGKNKSLFGKEASMHNRRFFQLLILAIAIASGCSRTPPISVTSETTRTVSVSADNAAIDDGESPIGIDGIPDGETLDLEITEMQTSDGQAIVDINTPQNQTN